MDRTLDSEMEAARAAARRRRSLRDRLLMAEDAAEIVVVTTVDGSVHAGRIRSVGSDHVDLDMAGRSRILPLQHITSIEGEW